ncbi:MAG: glycoside hydrolase family 19 protein [Plesiomonas sp.]
MKIVYPMLLGDSSNPTEVASLDAFIGKLSDLNSGTFPIGRNRLWHGGIHLSEKGGWHPSGAVRAIADGEIVVYRLATQPAKATRQPEQGQPGQHIDLYTSPSFCLIRHHYEAGEQNKNRLTFYSLYMHIACDNTYSAEAEHHLLTGSNVSIYSAMAGLQLKAEDKLGSARQGAEIILMDNPSERRNLKNEPHTYQLVRYTTPKNGEPPEFYVATQYIKAEHKTKPRWMTPPESKPARYKIPHNAWLRKTPQSTTGSLGLSAGSEVVVSAVQQIVTINGGPTEFRKVQVFKAGNNIVKDSASQDMPSAHKNAVGWLAKSKIGTALAAESHSAIEFDKVVDCSQNPIIVRAGDIIGHWGEHQIATSSTSGFNIDPDQKAVHFEVFVVEKDQHDKQALEDCIQNKARITHGQNYLVIKKDKKVTTCRLTHHNNQPSYTSVATFGPLTTPLAVKKSDIVTHGAQQFVRIREQAAAEDELAGEFVLLTGDAQLINQHDWSKLGAMLIDGSHDPDGFLDKADTEGKEGSIFFSTLYEQLVTDKNGDKQLTSDEIKSALADTDLASKLRRLFIKHESEWIKRGDHWPRLKKELAAQPNLYKYAMQVHNNMAWVEEAKNILGNTHMWFIHPAGLMGLVGENHSSECIITVELIENLLGHTKPWFTGKNGGKLFANYFKKNHQDVYEYNKKTFVNCLNEKLYKYGITNPYHKAHFLSQCLHESSCLDTTIEFGSGKNYDPGKHKDAIKNGNTIMGYGPKYRGRGLIQLTWRNNYMKFSDHSGVDCVNNPDLISSDISNAIEVSCWFWRYNGGIHKKFNALGDINILIDNEKNNVKLITLAVNGGENGLIEREKYFSTIKKSWGLN